jgi:hypothetical protein
LGAVEVAVVIRREEVAIGRVADNPHIHPVAAADVLSDDARNAAKEVLRGRPTSRIAKVLVGRVGSISILEDQVPQLLRLKVKDLRCSAVARSNSTLVEIEEWSIPRLAKIGEIKIH